LIAKEESTFVLLIPSRTLHRDSRCWHSEL